MKKSFFLSVLLGLVFTTNAYARHVKINFSTIHTSFELQNMLQKELDFPEYYGKNWDAFMDSMRDLLGQDYLEIDFLRVQNFKRDFPRDYRLMRECLRDLKNEYPDSFRFKLYN